MASRFCRRSRATSVLLAFFLHAIFVLFATRPALADDAQEATYGDASQSFTWFSAKGYPDVAKARLVVVTKGRDVPNGATDPHCSREYSFLLSEDANHFTVLSPTLQTAQYTKAPAPPKTPGGDLAGNVAWFEPADLAHVAKVELDDPRGMLRGQDGNPRTLRFSWRIPETTRLFILAWSCSRQGHAELAEALFERAKRIPEYHRIPFGGTRYLHERVEEEVAELEMWEICVAFSDPTISRQSLYDRSTIFLKRFPDSEHVARVRGIANLLAMMIVEERGHAAIKPGDPAWDKLGQKEQIAELIFQLRDQNSHQMWSDGPLRISFGFSDQQSPADRLLGFGHDAVPQLIDALGDPRPTRSVGAHRTYCFSHDILTVGDCACEILEKIAARAFWKHNGSSSYMSKDCQNQVAEKAARDWYAEFLGKGEKQVLVDGTSAGDRNSPAQGASLVKKYPDAALPALIAGARAAKEDHVRVSLVYQIGNLTGDEPLAFILAELKDSPFGHCRLAAANILNRLGRPEGEAAMLDAWQHPAKTTSNSSASGPEIFRGFLAQFLANHGGAEALRALAQTYSSESGEVRHDIANSLAYRNMPAGGADLPGSEPQQGPPKQPTGRAALRTALLDLLMTIIDDSEGTQGAMWIADKQLSNPRNCDLAGYALARLDPAQFSFDVHASLADRERVRVVLKNIWLKEQRKPEEPLPASPSSNTDSLYIQGFVR
ncbi:MAG TPA: hypothetical protein VMF30_00855 [Pirellulales bacterium]|nr:hypothetical protein [Pirellulales bacterium]